MTGLSSSASNAIPSLIHRLNLNVVGGVEVSFAQYAAHRQALGAVDTVIVGDDINPRFRPAVEAPLRAVSRRQFRWWRGLRLPRVARGLRARNAMARAVRGDEAAFVGWDSIGNREILDIARRARLPLIHYEHGQAWRPEVRHARAFFEETRGVIVNSRAAERVLALRWGWSGPTERVYCAVDTVLTAEAARPGPPHDRPLRLGSAARMVEAKGHRIALHALKVLRVEHGIDARLTIAGTGEGDTALRAETRLLGLDDVVHFEGAVADMAAFYDVIDLMLVPSLLEPFGRTSIEAQARGCPVVVTAVDGLPETLGPDMPEAACVMPEWSLADYARELGENTATIWPWVYDPLTDDLIRPRAVTPDRLARAVVTLIETDGLYHRASRSGLAHARARFMASDYGPAVDAAIMRLVATGG